MINVNNEEKSVLAVIPARLNSSRFPRKVLADILGYPMLYYVYKAVAACNAIDTLCVACDDMRVMEVCHQWNIPCQLTAKKHRCGTERVIEIQSKQNHDIILNVQADEPLLKPSMIMAILNLFKHNAHGVGSLKTKIHHPQDYANSNIVKVCCNEQNHALEFCRVVAQEDKSHYDKHIGIYAYDKATLNIIQNLPPSSNEVAFNLEQYRFLDNQISIFLANTPYNTIGVDHPSDIQAVIHQLKKSGL